MVVVLLDNNLIPDPMMPWEGLDVGQGVWYGSQQSFPLFKTISGCGRGSKMPLDKTHKNTCLALSILMLEPVRIYILHFFSSLIFLILKLIFKVLTNGNKKIYCTCAKYMQYYNHVYNMEFKYTVKIGSVIPKLFRYISLYLYLIA